MDIVPAWMMSIWGFYGLDYLYGSRTTAHYGDSVRRCLLVVGGSGAQPSGYLTEELSQAELLTFI